MTTLTDELTKLDIELDALPPDASIYVFRSRQRIDAALLDSVRILGSQLNKSIILLEPGQELKAFTDQELAQVGLQRLSYCAKNGFSCQDDPEAGL